MEIGIINKLKVVRKTEYGYELQDEEKNEVFLSRSLVNEELNIDDDKEVFICHIAFIRIRDGNQWYFSSFVTNIY